MVDGEISGCRQCLGPFATRSNSASWNHLVHDPSCRGYCAHGFLDPEVGSGGSDVGMYDRGNVLNAVGKVEKVGHPR
jgi:hypothetical protein